MTTDNSAAVKSVADVLRSTMKETTPDSGRFSVTMKDHMKIMESQGVSESSVRALATAQGIMHEAANQVLGEKLVEKINAAKKAGDDPSGLTVTLSAPMPNSSTKYMLRASKTVNDPQNLGSRKEIFGSFGIKHKMSQSVGRESIQRTADTIAKLMKK